jgi:broad specificity phosphatase PhoE
LTSPASPRLLLARHGQDVDGSRSILNGRRDPPLTDLGRTQAGILANDLQSANIDCIYTSPLQRASVTASIIARQLGAVNVRIDADLIERDYGSLTGCSFSDIPTLARETFVSHGFRHVIQAPGVEDYGHLWIRAGSVLRQIVSRHCGQTILIVAHNEILRMIRANFVQRSWRAELAFPPISHCQLIDLSASLQDSRTDQVKQASRNSSREKRDGDA